MPALPSGTLSAVARKRTTPNPNGREGDPLKIDLPFDEAIRAALEVKPKAERVETRRPRQSPKKRRSQS